MTPYKYAFGTVIPVSLMTVDTVAGAVGITSHTIGISGILFAGDPVQINGAWYYIASVTGGFTADLNRVAESTLNGVPIGWFGTIAFIDSVLGMPPPKGTFMPYSKALPLPNGRVRGGGWKTAEWRWGFLEQSWRTSLRAYWSTLPSADLYIFHRVYEGPDIYQWFQASGLWPQEEDRETGRRLSFTIKWQNMVQLSAYTS